MLGHADWGSTNAQYTWWGGHHYSEDKSHGMDVHDCANTGNRHSAQDAIHMQRQVSQCDTVATGDLLGYRDRPRCASW